MSDINWYEMLRYFSCQPISFMDFITLRWIGEMRRRAHWPKQRS